MHAHYDLDHGAGVGKTCRHLNSSQSGSKQRKHLLVGHEFEKAESSDGSDNG